MIPALFVFIFLLVYRLQGVITTMVLIDIPDNNNSTHCLIFKVQYQIEKKGENKKKKI